MEDQVRRAYVPRSIHVLRFDSANARLRRRFFMGLPILILYERFFRCLHRPTRCPTITTSPRGLPTINLTLIGVPPITVRGVLFLIRGIIVHDFMFTIRRFSVLFVAHRSMWFDMSQEDRGRNIAPDPTFRYLEFTVVRFRVIHQQILRRPVHTNGNEVRRVFILVFPMGISGRL